MPAFAEPLRGTRHQAYGETIAPPKVDTLRDENCPICQESDAYDGNTCGICQYVAPPSPFADPDLGLAGRIDLRKEQDDFENSQVPNPDRALAQEEAGALICPACGTEFAATDPGTVDTDAAGEQPPGTAEGDLCPNCGKGVLETQGDLAEMGEEVPGDEAGEGFPPGEEPEDEELDEPDPDEEEPEPEDEELPGIGVPSPDGQEPDDEEEPDEGEDEPPVRKGKPKTNG